MTNPTNLSPETPRPLDGPNLPHYRLRARGGVAVKLRTRVLTLVVALVAALAPVLSAAGPAAAATAPYSLRYIVLGYHKQVVARWNPCRAHTYKVNLAAVPSASKKAILAETQTAVRLLGAKTGMSFVYKGATAEVPRVGSYDRQSADVIIAYTTPSRTNYSLAGAIVGQGGYNPGWKSTTGTAAIAKAMIVLDTPDLLRNYSPGFGPGRHRANVLLHELGHVVGLGHASSARLLMNPYITGYTPSGYAAGDTTGLAAVGRRAGCIAGW